MADQAFIAALPPIRRFSAKRAFSRRFRAPVKEN
jgi:hypothetical protein